MFVVKYRKIFYTFSILLIAFCVFSVVHYGLDFGIDFKGGAQLEVAYPTNYPTQEIVSAEIASSSVGEFTVRTVGTDGYIITTGSLTEVQHQALITALGPNAQVKQFNSVGPVLGQELQQKSTLSVILVLLAIVLFITFVFRKVSHPVSSWKYGLVAIIALMHDIIVPTGIYAFIGRSGGYQIDALFVTAILVILGFSVHDTIVVFDRTRENLKHDSGGKKDFAQIVGESISQTFARSINTSVTTVLALVALFVFGPEATHNFALVLIIGIIGGTYSSIFIGSPLLVTLQKLQGRKSK